VDRHVSGDLLPPLHRLFVFHSCLIPDTLLHLQQ
jgi:hypothetical protein